MTFLSLSTTSVDALLYGFFGGLGGAVVAWIGAKHLLRKPWSDLLALLHRHVAATEQLASSTTIKQEER